MPTTVIFPPARCFKDFELATSLANFISFLPPPAQAPALTPIPSGSHRVSASKQGKFCSASHDPHHPTQNQEGPIIDTFPCSESGGGRDLR